MHAGDYLVPRGAFRRALLFLRETALDFGQRLFLSAKEAWVGNLLPIAQGGEGLEAHVYAHLLSRFRQGQRFSTLAGEADIPLAGAAAADGGCLGHALQGTMHDDLDLAHAVQPQTARVRAQFAPAGYLGV